MSAKKFIRPSIFIVILIILFLLINFIMVNPNDGRVYQATRGIYSEKDDSLDIIYIGASTSYAFLSPMVAYKNFGITSFSYTVSSMPVKGYKYFIEEARKTQPNAFFVLTFSTFNNDDAVYTEHRVVDYMKWSSTKYNLIKALAETEDDFKELVFPMLRYHSRWGDMKYADISRKLDGTKNGMYYSIYLNNSTDFTDFHYETDDMGKLDDDFVETIYELINYCRDNDVKYCALFPPRCAEEYELYAGQNTLRKIFEEEGVEILDYRQEGEEMGISTTTDFYNTHHTNIHGSIKYTNYVISKLVEEYGFTDKRNNPEVKAEWDQAYNKYYKKIKSAIFDFEWVPENRDYTMTLPKLTELVHDGDKMIFSWEKTDDCEGYSVYRRTFTDGVWEEIATTTEASYADTVGDCEDYFYTAIPYKIVDGKRIYGNFNYQGLTLLPYTVDDAERITYYRKKD